MKKMDRRQLRTKRRIHQAFVELVIEKDLDHITIKELAQRADIDRKTFYLHYGAIWDVMEEMQEELLQKVDRLISKYDLFRPDFNALGFFRELNAIIGQDSDFYRRALEATQYSFFYDKLKERMKIFLWDKYHHHIAQTKVSLCKLSLYAEYATAGVVALYVEWFKHPEYDLEEVAEAVSEISYGGGRKVLSRILEMDVPQQEVSL